MINLKEETSSMIDKLNLEVDYCHIYKEEWPTIEAIGRKDLCKGELDLNKLDFSYDDGYGTQRIFGFVVFTDGSWLERYEYDGSECWIHKTKPLLEGN